MYYPQQDLMRQHYSATPSGYSMSSGVSTPAMTPPFAQPLMDGMLSHHPAWMMNNENPLLAQVQQLQLQTSHLALMIKEQIPRHVPMYMTPPSPAPPVASSGYADALLAAQQVLHSVPHSQQLEESVLAKAVVAAANALLNSGRTGHISALRVPTAVRPNDSAEVISNGFVFANYKRSTGESPAPSEGGSKCNSPLRESVPVFGLEPKSPGTVTKCARQED